MTMLEYVVIDVPVDEIFHALHLTDAPRWHLSGTTPLPQLSEDSYRLCLWGEGRAWSEDSLKGFKVSTTLTDEEREQVYRDAALRAIHIAIHEGNYKWVTEELLNRHPECRKEADEFSAIIAAALQERKDTYTEEMYETY